MARKLAWATVALFFAYSVGYRLGDHTGFNRGVNQTIDVVIDAFKKADHDARVTNL